MGVPNSKYEEEDLAKFTSTGSDDDDDDNGAHARTGKPQIDGSDAHVDDDDGSVSDETAERLFFGPSADSTAAAQQQQDSFAAAADLESGSHTTPAVEQQDFRIYPANASTTAPTTGDNASNADVVVRMPTSATRRARSEPLVEKTGTGADDDDDDGALSDERVEDERATSVVNMLEMFGFGADGDEELLARLGNPTAFGDVEEMALEFAPSHERDIYLVRRYRYPRSMFVVAHDSTPLLAHLRHIGALEIECRRVVESMHPPALRANASEEEVAEYIPGILARVAKEVLQEPPQFIAPTDEGGKVRVFRDDDGDPVPARADGVSLPLAAAPLLVIDRADADYHERLAAARHMQSEVTSGGENALRDIDNRLKNGHLQRFRVTGNRLQYGDEASPGWDGVSPVTEHEDDVWWIVNLHYYLSWRAFEQSCEGNGNLLATINTRLSMIDEKTFFFPLALDNKNGSSDSGAVTYSARQEHAVLMRMLEMYRKTLVSEAQIDTTHAHIRNLVETSIGVLTPDAMKAINNALGPQHKEEREAVGVLFNMLQAMNKQLGLLDTARANRVYSFQ